MPASPVTKLDMVSPQQVNILCVCDSPARIAQQLTHIELERLNNIGPEEFIQTFVKSTEEKEVMSILRYVLSILSTGAGVATF